MKYLFQVSLCTLSLVFLLTACGPKVTSPKDEEFQDAWDGAWSALEEGEHVPDLNKQHYYQVLDSQGEELYTITDNTQVEALDDLLGNIGERLEESPSKDEEIACIYVYCQEKTLLAGQSTDAEREYEELIRFTVFQNQDLATGQVLTGGLGDMDLLGIGLDDLLTFTVSLSAETAGTLRDPAQFAE